MTMTRVIAIVSCAVAFTVLHPTAGLSQKNMQLLAADTGWVLRYEKLHWTSDNGTHWTDITPRMSLLGEQIEDVFFKDAQQGWVLLSAGPNDEFPEATFELAATTNAGATWRVGRIRVPELGPPERSALPGRGQIFFLDSLRGWMNLMVEGSSNFAPALLLATTDGGATWTKSDSPGWGAVLFTTTTDGWIAGGPGGQHLYSTDSAGATWTDHPLTHTLQVDSAGIYSPPVFSDRLHGFVPVNLQSETAVVLFETNDGGRSWKPNQSVRDPAIANRGSPVPSAILDSLWLMAKCDGASITVITIPLKMNATGAESRTGNIQQAPIRAFSLLEVSFINAERGWAHWGQLYATVDGGRTWNDATPEPRP